MITYTNRKGDIYYLCCTRAKNGRVRYIFRKEPKDTVVKTMPQGYEIRENVNGIVSLARKQTLLLRENEIRIVEQAVAQHPESELYRLEYRANRIVIHEQTNSGIKDILKMFAEQAGVSVADSPVMQKGIDTKAAQMADYQAVVRFTLRDKQARLFNAERFCFLGGIDNWITIGHLERLESLVKIIIPTLGTEAFYELF